MSDSLDTKVRQSAWRGLTSWFPRFGLRSLLLLIAAVATWTSYYAGRQKIAETVVALESLHALAPELHVRNPNEYACLAIDRDDDIMEYHCYLPPNGKYMINLVANREFSPNDDLVKGSAAEFMAEIAPGEHRVLLDEQPDKLIVTVDGQNVFEIPRREPLSTSRSWSGASQTYQQQWHAVDAPLPLIRLTQRRPEAKWDDPSPGIALWIDRVEASVQGKKTGQETNKASSQKK